MSEITAVGCWILLIVFAPNNSVGRPVLCFTAHETGVPFFFSLIFLTFIIKDVVVFTFVLKSLCFVCFHVTGLLLVLIFIEFVI